MDKNLTQFDNQMYLNLETFRKSGEAVRTPVWFVQAGNIFYVRTVQTSGKIKRVRNNGLVNIMPCGQMGEPLGTWVSAQARQASDEATATLVRKLLIEKYAEMVAMFESRAKASGQEYTVIQIETGV